MQKEKEDGKRVRKMRSSKRGRMRREREEKEGRRRGKETKTKGEAHENYTLAAKDPNNQFYTTI